MDSQASEGTAGVVATPPTPGRGAERHSVPFVDPYDANRKAEELRMLLFGFGTGMTIACIFLVYIVLEAARLLP